MSSVHFQLGTINTHHLSLCLFPCFLSLSYQITAKCEKNNTAFCSFDITDICIGQLPACFNWISVTFMHLHVCTRTRGGSLTFFTFESMTEDVLQDRNKVNKLWRWVIYCLKTGAVQQSLHWKPEHKRRWIRQLHQYIHIVTGGISAWALRLYI